MRSARMQALGRLLVLMLPIASGFVPYRSSTFRAMPMGAQRQQGLARRPSGWMACLPDSALLVSAARAASSTFEAQPPPLGTSVAVLGSTAGVIAYWWLVLVPSERRDLAKNKNKVRRKLLSSQQPLCCRY